MGSFDGKVAIVTGGANGIGKAQVTALVREGCKVVINDHGTRPDGAGSDPSMATRLAAELGSATLANTEDVSQRDGVDRLMQAALERFGRVDILIHGVGFLCDQPLVELDDASWERTQAGILRSTYLCIQAAARHMIARGGGGRIITTSSLIGLVGGAGMPAYAAAKAAIYGLTRVASMELGTHGITANVLSPIAYTRLTAALPVMAHTPNAASIFSPDFVADVTLFLASDAAANVTGTIVDVQGRQVSLMRMTQGGGVLPRGDRWSVDELRERWAEISAS